MSNNLKDTSPERKLTLSIGPANITGSQNTHFTTTQILVSDLKSFLTNNNYSAINWIDGHRLESNFQSAEALVIDIDDGSLSVEQAVALLQKLKLNHVVITSKSHTDDHNRFHILIPFNRRIVLLSEYKKVLRAFRDAHFPNSDSSVVDGARFFYYSPSDARFLSFFSGNDLDVDAMVVEEIDPIVLNFASIGRNAKRIDNSWDDALLVKVGSNGQVCRAVELAPETPIYCPFHYDSNPSAFIGFSDNSFNHFIYCSACNKTFWHAEDASVIKKRYSQFWSHGDSIYEAGFTGMDFSFEKIGKDKFNARARLMTKPEQEEAFAYLAKEKHLHGLGIVEYHGDIDAKTKSFEVQQEKGLTIVIIPGIAESIHDNDFIETYLSDTFGQYKDFIKQWIAVYSFSNNRKLPTIVLLGERGTGKNTFAELIGEIFNSLSVPIDSLAGSFNPFVEKKLAILDESIRGGKLQYSEIKKLSGSDTFEINKKYVAQYKVRNNLNLIILSNELIPITVAAGELPKDHRNNQFFVYQMPMVTGMIEPNLGLELRKRLGHYIRTELRSIFHTIPSTGFRYAISTPITKWEQDMFNFSLNESEQLIDLVVDKLIELYESNGLSIDEPNAQFIKAGFIPKRLFTDTLGMRANQINTLLMDLVNTNVVATGTGMRRTVNKRKATSYKMTSEFLLKLRKQTL